MVIWLFFSQLSKRDSARSILAAIVLLKLKFGRPFMHQSLFQRCPSPPPPGQPRGICSHCQSRGWGIRNFIAARGLGISIPRGNLWAFDTRVFEIEISFFIGKDEAFVKDWLVHQGLEKLVDVFKGMFSQT